VTVSAEIVALIAAAVAVFSAVLAVRATALVARTVVAAQPVAAPGSPLSFRVNEGHTRRDVATDTRDYVFAVAISNASTSERRLDPVMLQVTYRTRANFVGAVDLAAAAAITVAAGATVATTLRFTTSNVIPRHCRIDAYTLMFTDAAGQRIRVDASLPAVLHEDTDGAAPATWGWD